MSAGRKYRRQLRVDVRAEPPVPDDAAPHIKDGLVLRAMTVRLGYCPRCGSDGFTMEQVAPGLLGGLYSHEAGCPAIHPDVERFGPSYALVTL